MEGEESEVGTSPRPSPKERVRSNERFCQLNFVR